MACCHGNQYVVSLVQTGSLQRGSADGTEHDEKKKEKSHSFSPTVPDSDSLCFRWVRAAGGSRRFPLRETSGWESC